VIFQADWYSDPSHAGTMPMLFGQELMVGDNARFQIPPFFALHVWLYQDNPSGMFESWNPNVSCSGGSASAASNLTARVSGVATLASSRAPRFVCKVSATA